MLFRTPAIEEIPILARLRKQQLIDEGTPLEERV